MKTRTILVAALSASFLCGCGPSKEELRLSAELKAKDEQAASLTKQLEEARSELTSVKEQLVESQRKLDVFDQEKRQREQIPARFRSQGDRLLEEGAKLQAMTAQGVKRETFANQLAAVKGHYDLMLASWPPQLDKEIRRSLERAFQAWSYADNMWDWQINQRDEPTEPNVNRYAEIVRFAPTELVIKVWNSKMIVPEYRNKNYLPFDPNIGILLNIGHKSFESAKIGLLHALDR
jgi:hypothetical protein